VGLHIASHLLLIIVRERYLPTSLIMNSKHQFRVRSPNVQYRETSIESTYEYRSSIVSAEYDVSVVTHKLAFKTDSRVPKLGVMLVGWGGNNGSTVTAGLLANKLRLQWETKEGQQSANFFGSLTQASTVRLVWVLLNSTFFVQMLCRPDSG
jgi:hypothetical protein